MIKRLDYNNGQSRLLVDPDTSELPVLHSQLLNILGKNEMNLFFDFDKFYLFDRDGFFDQLKDKCKIERKKYTQEEVVEETTLDDGKNRYTFRGLPPKYVFALGDTGPLAAIYVFPFKRNVKVAVEKGEVDVDFLPLLEKFRKIVKIEDMFKRADRVVASEIEKIYGGRKPDYIR